MDLEIAKNYDLVVLERDWKWAQAKFSSVLREFRENKRKGGPEVTRRMKQTLILISRASGTKAAGKKKISHQECSGKKYSQGRPQCWLEEKIKKVRDKRLRQYRYSS